MTQTKTQPRQADGQFSTRMNLDDVLDGMEENEPYTAREVGDRFGLPRTTANYYLNQLADAGRVRKKKFHALRVVWIKPA